MILIADLNILTQLTQEEKENDQSNKYFVTSTFSKLVCIFLCRV